MSGRVRLRMNAVRNTALLVGVAGLVACAVGGLSNARQFFECNAHISLSFRGNRVLRPTGYKRGDGG